MNTEPESKVTTETIYRELHDRLMAFVVTRVPCREDAEDVVHDVFARIHRALTGGAAPENVGAWVFQITRHSIADFHRARAKRHALEVPYETFEDQAVEEQSQAPPHTVAEELLLMSLSPLMKGLSPTARQALELTDLGHLTQREAAQTLELSVSGMKSRVQRSREQLKDLLLDCCDVELDPRRRVVGLSPKGQSCACE